MALDPHPPQATVGRSCPRPRVSCRGPAHSQFRGGCSGSPELPAPSCGPGPVGGRREEVGEAGAGLGAP